MQFQLTALVPCKCFFITVRCKG